MAPKKFTDVEKFERKITMTMVEMKKGTYRSVGKMYTGIGPGSSVRFLWNVSHIPSSNISPLHFLFLFWLVNVCMILCI
jgi:hypothetical protein